MTFQEGCKESMPLCRLEDHVNECEFNQKQRIPCPLECGFVGRKAQLADHNCIQYLKKELELAKKGITPHQIEKTEIKTARKEIKKLWEAINYKPNSSKVLALFDKLNSKDSANSCLNAFRYQYDQGFDKYCKERIVDSLMNSIVECDTYFAIATNSQKELGALFRNDLYMHCMVGFNDHYSAFVRYRKFIVVYICNIKVVVFVTYKFES